MILLNSSNNLSKFSDFVQTTASPKKRANTRADITENTGGISTLNIISGNSLKPSTVDTMFNLGIKV